MRETQFITYRLIQWPYEVLNTIFIVLELKTIVKMSLGKSKQISRFSNNNKLSQQINVQNQALTSRTEKESKLFMAQIKNMTTPPNKINHLATNYLPINQNIIKSKQN